jgi:hypothetical protein
VRWLALAALLAAAPAGAQPAPPPGWDDAPAMLTAAVDAHATRCARASPARRARSA